MREALDLAVAAAQAQGAERIVRMRLVVGVDSGVVPDALAFAFDVVRAGTIASDAELSIDAIAGVDLRLASIEVAGP